MSEPSPVPAKVIEYPSSSSRPRKSGYLLGWISLGLFAIAGGLLGTCFLIGYLEPFEDDERIWIVVTGIAFLAITSVLAALAGLILAILGVCPGRIERVVPLQGLCLNAAFLIGLTLYVVSQIF